MTEPKSETDRDVAARPSGDAAPWHSQRAALTAELHARPFSPVTAPCRLVHYSFLPEPGAGPINAQAALQRMRDLVAALGGDADAIDMDGPTPNHRIAHLSPPGMGPVELKWERHTEFVSYVFTVTDPSETLFSEIALVRALPEEWLAGGSDGRIISATIVEIQPVSGLTEAEQAMRDRMPTYLEPVSTAMAFVSGNAALASGDFQIDAAGFTRFGLLATGDIGPRRLGRVAQRLIELETYRTLSMLALPMARGLGPQLNRIDADLAEISRDIASAEAQETLGGGKSVAEARQRQERETLNRLTEIAAELEGVAAETAFRFGAARAYETIVDERLQALRQTRVSERPDFNEFMVRRYKPAMRTVRSVEGRLSALSARAERAANLLRTRVDVSLNAQNQDLLHSMDRRASLQLRLQQTVEGLSVVAISYYAVSLAGYLLTPLGDGVGLDEKWVKAIAAIPIIAAVWWFVRRIRKRVEKGEGAGD